MFKKLLAAIDILYKNWVAARRLNIFFKNYKTLNSLNVYFEGILAEEWKSIDITDKFYATIETCSGNKITFWYTNKYYAWACRGEYCGGIYKWDSVMPSRYILLQLKLRIDKEQDKIINKGEN